MFYFTGTLRLQFGSAKVNILISIYFADVVYVYENWIFIYSMSVAFDLEFRYWKFLIHKMKYNEEE